LGQTPGRRACLTPPPIGRKACAKPTLLATPRRAPYAAAVIARRVLPWIVMVVLLPSFAIAGPRVRCADEAPRRHACCPPARPRPPLSIPALQRGCCQLVPGQAAPAPVATTAAAPEVPAPSAVAVAVAPLAPAPRALVLAIVPRAQAPPAARTLVAQHIALLV
jgi:hypothetical protein